MPLGGFNITKAPAMQRVQTVNDLYDIAFSQDGLAAVEVPFAMLPCLPLVGAERNVSPRLDAVVASMRRRGYQANDPIICRIGMKGRWVVVDGGHRITAARIVGEEFWANLFGRHVRSLYFLLFTTPDSWSKLRPRNVAPTPAVPRPKKRKKPKNQKLAKKAKAAPGLE
ncbi:MAG: ParB/Srx family N-terminal domain-containing protein [Pseudomonadota bacterium]